MYYEYIVCDQVQIINISDARVELEIHLLRWTQKPEL